MINSYKFLIVVFAWCLPSNVSGQIVTKGKRASIDLKTENSTLALKDPITKFSGRLKMFDDTATRITSDVADYDVITFEGGLLDTGSGDISFTGTYVPGASSDITLSTGSALNLTGNTVARGVSVGAGQTADLKGYPNLSGDVTLGDASAQLNIALVNKTNQNIVLGGGTVRLDDDLRFIDGKGFTGTGTVDINNRTLFRPGGVTVTGAVSYLNAADIQFTGNQTLDGTTENYSGVGLESLVNGNGYTWNLVNGAGIIVGANHTLYLTDMRIKGLGPTGTDGYFSIDVTSTVVLANVTLDMSGNYTHNAGTILVEGDNCRVIHHDNTFTVNSAETRLRVDGVVFQYEPLDGSEDSPFSFADEAEHVQLVNGGIIRTSKAGGGESSLVIDTTPYTLTANHRITDDSILQFTNASPGTPKPMELDGNGYYIQFPANALGKMELQENVQLTLKDVVLKDFYPEAIAYAAASSTITFDENVRIELAHDIDVTAGDRAWVFDFSGTTSSTIEGNGHTISFQDTDKLTINGSAALQVDNAKLDLAVSDAMSLLSSNAILRLKDSQILINENNFDFDAGNLEVSGACKIAGHNRTTTGGSSTFSFSSPGNLTVLSKSSLELAPDTTFEYLADASGDTGDTSAAKRHFKMTDPSSSLILDSCTLQTTTSGMALDYGKMLVKNQVDLNINTGAAAQFELGSGVDVQIMGGSILNVDGPLDYVSTSYP